MTSPLRFRIHALDHADAVFKTAEARSLALEVVTPPGALAYAGADYFTGMINTCRDTYPTAAVRAYLDCGTDGAVAVAAVAGGWPNIVLDRSAPSFDRVAAIADLHGVELMAVPPPAYDLQPFPDAEAACSDFIMKHRLTDNPKRGRNENHPQG